MVFHIFIWSQLYLKQKLNRSKNTFQTEMFIKLIIVFTFFPLAWKTSGSGAVCGVQ